MATGVGRVHDTVRPHLGAKMLAREFGGTFTKRSGSSKVLCAANGHFVTGIPDRLWIHCGTAQDLFRRCPDRLEDCNTRASFGAARAPRRASDHLLKPARSDSTRRGRHETRL